MLESTNDIADNQTGTDNNRGRRQNTIMRLEYG